VLTRSSVNGSSQRNCWNGTTAGLKVAWNSKLQLSKSYIRVRGPIAIKRSLIIPSTDSIMHSTQEQTWMACDEEAHRDCSSIHHVPPVVRERQVVVRVEAGLVSAPPLLPHPGKMHIAHPTAQ
jgi:hypothetical protein